MRNDGNVLVRINGGEVVIGREAHGAGIKTGDLVAVEIGGDVAQGGKDFFRPADTFQRQPHIFQHNGVRAKVAPRSGNDGGLFAKQGQRIGNITRATAAPFIHAVHHEAHVDHVQLVHQDVILKTAREGHDAVKSQ